MTTNSSVMEVLEAIDGVHDVHLRDKCQKAITAVQRTIDLYGCALRHYKPDVRSGKSVASRKRSACPLTGAGPPA